jgi:hypothetical protein
MISSSSMSCALSSEGAESLVPSVLSRGLTKSLGLLLFSMILLVSISDFLWSRYFFSGMTTLNFYFYFSTGNCGWSLLTVLCGMGEGSVVSL